MACLTRISAGAPTRLNEIAMKPLIEDCLLPALAAALLLLCASLVHAHPNSPNFVRKVPIFGSP
jgi:hypothetical protein